MAMWHMPWSLQPLWVWAFWRVGGKAVMARSRGGVDVLAGPGETVEILVQFSSLAEWYQMRRKIQQLQGARDFQEGGVSAAAPRSE